MLCDGMPVYVDNAQLPFRDMLMSHMTADTLDELHEMADRIGMQRRWFQKPPKASYPHYDIPDERRFLAIKYGTIPIGRRATLHYAAKLGLEWARECDDEVLREEVMARSRKAFERSKKYALIHAASANAPHEEVSPGEKL